MFVLVNNSAVSQAPFQFIGEPSYSHQAKHLLCGDFIYYINGSEIHLTKLIRYVMIMTQRPNIKHYPDIVLLFRQCFEKHNQIKALHHMVRETI